MSMAPETLERQFPRGVGSVDTLPSNRWEDWREIERYDRFNPEANMIPLGRYGETICGTASDQLELLLANARSGKSVSNLVPILLLSRNNILCFDFKTELSRITLRRRVEMGHKVLVLDASGMVADHVKPYCSSFNIYSIIDLNSPRLIEDLSLIADSLVIRSSDREKHWDDNAASFIRLVSLHMVTFYRREDWTLVTLRRLLTGDVTTSEAGETFAGFKALEIDMRGNNHRSARGLVQSGAGMFFTKEEKELNSILSTCQTHTAFLDFPSIQELVQDPENPDLSFTFEEFKTKDGLSVYLSMSVEQMLSCMGYLRCLVSICMSRLEREQYQPKRPPIVLLDEFPAMGKMALIQKYCGFSIGVKLIIVTQTIAMLRDIYGKEGASAFTQGMIVAFGLSDDESLEFISKRLGKLYIETSTTSVSDTITTTSGANLGDPVHALLAQGGKAALANMIAQNGASEGTSHAQSSTTGTSWQSVDLLTTAELATLFGRYDPGLQIVINPGDKPVWVERLVYYKDPEFKGLWDQ